MQRRAVRVSAVVLRAGVDPLHRQRLPGVRDQRVVHLELRWVRRRVPEHGPGLLGLREQLRLRDRMLRADRHLVQRHLRGHYLERLQLLQVRQRLPGADSRASDVRGQHLRYLVQQRVHPVLRGGTRSRDPWLIAASHFVGPFFAS